MENIVSNDKGTAKTYNSRYYQANRERFRQYAKDRRQKSYEQHISKKYGISRAEYDAMLKNQNGTCAICNVSPEHNLCVDHDHKTGQIRGLLCRKCNLLIGQFRDEIEYINQAYNYLMKNVKG